MPTREGPVQDYRKLDVWTKSHELALDVHRCTAGPAGAGAGAGGAARYTGVSLDSRTANDFVTVKRS